MDGIYLDYAATSAIRPPEVIEAVASYLRDIGATPGRSGHARSVAAGRVALHCRLRLAELFGIGGDPGRIVFQLNATHALNTALFGLLDPGDRLVRTRYDHNAVRRPAAALAARGVEVSVLDVGVDGSIDLDALERHIRGSGEPAKLLAIPHASNVTGVVLPVREMAAIAHAYGTLVLLDTAQTAGHHPIDVERLSADLLAFTGHKGLLGPQGVGGLWVADGVDVRPLLHGGTGGDSAPPAMPEAYPDHLEAGTQNAPGMAGLAAGVAWILERGVHALHDRERKLKARLLAAVRGIPGLNVCSPAEEAGVGVVTLVCDGLAPGELARILDRDHGIQGRAGLHCAPEAHQIMGTFETGAFRLSTGWTTTEAEIDRVSDALREVAASASAGA